MKVKVDNDLCIGCGLCVDICPEVFQMEDDKAVVKIQPNSPDVTNKCKQAKDDCPVEAIIIEE